MLGKIGKFELIRPLGQGAMGEVYLAKDPVLGRQVAVKTIRLGSSFGDEATARFEREAQVAGSLNHPNVVTVFEFGEDEGVHYLAMEHVDGEDLNSLIRSGLAQAELLELLAQACEGLAYAHERGIVHRDIKPSNILVARSGKRRVAKLMDFGVALVVAKSGRGQCMSLRVALRQAEPGARIRVQPGVYRESLVVDRPVTILGEGGPGEVVIESAKGPCLSLQAPGVHLSNLQVQALDEDGAPALEAGPGQALVERCEIIARSGFAVRIAGAGPGPAFRDCTLRSAGAGGVQLREQAAVRMDDCLVEGEARCGLSLEPGARATLDHCLVQNTRGTGVALGTGARAVLTDCQVCGQEAGGVEVEADARAELNRCRIADSRSVGVLVLERGQAALDDCEVAGHAWAGVHTVPEGTAQLRGCRVSGNAGLGVSVVGAGLLTLDRCELKANREPAVLVQDGAIVQMKACQVADGDSFGVVCAAQGRGVLEGCEIHGNARTGAKVEPGGSLLLVRCDLHDGRDTGILLFEHGEVTLEECVVHRNARGGILLAKDASDPVLRGGNRIQDALLRTSGDGKLVRVAPVK